MILTITFIVPHRDIEGKTQNFYAFQRLGYHTYIPLPTTVGAPSKNINTHVHIKLSITSSISWKFGIAFLYQTEENLCSKKMEAKPNFQLGEKKKERPSMSSSQIFHHIYQRKAYSYHSVDFARQDDHQWWHYHTCTANHSKRNLIHNRKN